MTLPKVYNIGTVSVANGSTVLTGTGTAWSAAVGPDDVFRKAGLSVRLLSVESDGSATLAEPWPGTTLSGASYEIAITYDGPDFQLRTRQLLELVGQVANTGIAIDAFGNLSDRAAYDTQATDFAFLSLDGDGVSIDTAVIFIKASAVSGDWADAISIQGPQGEQGENGEDGDPGLIGDWKGPWVTAHAYAVDDAVSFNGSSYICVAAHTSGGDFNADLVAGKWQLVAERGHGPIWRGAWSSGVTYVLNDVVSDNDAFGNPAAWFATQTGLNKRPKDNASYWDFFPGSFPQVQDLGNWTGPVDITRDLGAWH